MIKVSFGPYEDVLVTPGLRIFEIVQLRRAMWAIPEHVSYKVNGVKVGPGHVTGHGDTVVIAKLTLEDRVEKLEQELRQTQDLLAGTRVLLGLSK